MDSERAARYGRAAARWARLLAGGRAEPGLRVFYGWDLDPGPGASPSPAARRSSRSSPSAGPTARPTSRSSTSGRRTCRATCGRSSGSRGGGGARIVVNQDGVAYPGWAGERTDELNVPLRRAVRAADHVVYQSEFSKRSSDAFLGEPRGSWEILPNAVDVDRFTPGEPPAGRPGRPPRRRPDPGLPARARARDVSPRARRAPGRAPPRRRAARVRPRADAAPPRPRRARSSSSAGTRRPRRPTCSAARTSSSTRRSTTPARRR